MIKASALLRTARLQAGLTQRELSRKARIPQPTIAAIERGRQDPRSRTLARLLHACGFELMFRPRMENVDRTLIREQLRRTPAERLRLAGQEGRFLLQLEATRKR